MGASEPLLYWTPRVLVILLALLLGAFSLDVFGAGYGFWGTVGALLIHLVPMFAVLVALAVAWRWEWLGGALFIALGAWYLVASGGRQHWTAYLVLTGGPVLIGLLFMAHRLVAGAPAEAEPPAEAEVREP